MAARERLVTQAAKSAVGDGLPALEASVRIVDRVHAALRDAILSGALAPGTQLSVPELSRRLSVSRSPVREAVLQLVADGLAHEQPRKGVAVTTVAPEDLTEIHEIREFLEALAARLCAQRCSPAMAQGLKAVLDDQERRIAARDAPGYFHTNAEFHRRIAEGAGNRRLTTFQALLQDQMALALTQLARQVEHMEAGLKEHRRILRAIAAHDADKAEDAMRSHIAKTAARLKGG